MNGFSVLCLNFFSSIFQRKLLKITQLLQTENEIWTSTTTYYPALPECSPAVFDACIIYYSFVRASEQMTLKPSP